MMSSWVTDLIFFRPLPVVAVMSAVSAVLLGNAGLSEVRGIHLKYSKFSTTAKSAAASISSRSGMLLAYTPAFISAFSSLILLLINNGDDESGFRFLLVTAALTVHFLKRILETLFVHKYSGRVALETAIPISLSYLMITTVTIYTQRLTQNAHLPEPSLDLKPFGVLLFVIGIAGNFYHHFLLSKLRTNSKEDSKEYKIPKGGMFNLVICPHYLFEIMVFYGISFMSQTLYSFAVAVGTTAYLTGRSYATRKWYLSKFDDFPPTVKALVPFVL